MSYNWGSMKQKPDSRKSKTITFRPSSDVLSLLTKAVTKKVGRLGEPRGHRSRLINEAIRQHFAHLAGKLEAKQ